jgi:hypothetical protein
LRQNPVEGLGVLGHGKAALGGGGLGGGVEEGRAGLGRQRLGPGPVAQKQRHALEVACRRKERMMRGNAEIQSVRMRVLLRVDDPVAHRPGVVFHVDVHRRHPQRRKGRLMQGRVHRPDFEPRAVGGHLHRPVLVGHVPRPVVPKAEDVVAGVGRDLGLEPVAERPVERPQQPLAPVVAERQVKDLERRDPVRQIARRKVHRLNVARLGQGEEVGGVAPQFGDVGVTSGAKPACGQMLGKDPHGAGVDRGVALVALQQSWNGHNGISLVLPHDGANPGARP